MINTSGGKHKVIINFRPGDKRQEVNWQRNEVPPQQEAIRKSKSGRTPTMLVSKSRWQTKVVGPQQAVESSAIVTFLVGVKRANRGRFKGADGGICISAHEEGELRWMGARVNSPTNFTPECFFDNERSGTMRRVQDAEVSSEHETFGTEESKAMALREEGDIIVFNANGTLLRIGEGKLSTSPELNGLVQLRAIASNKPMKELTGVPRRL